MPPFQESDRVQEQSWEVIDVLVFEVEKRQRGCLGGCVELQLLELTREREF